MLDIDTESALLRCSPTAVRGSQVGVSRARSDRWDAFKISQLGANWVGICATRLGR